MSHRDCSARVASSGTSLVIALLLTALLASVASAVTISGELDPTFGTGGTATISVGSGWANAAAMAQQDDGKLIVAGCDNGCYFDSNFALVRLEPNGLLDATWGTGGVVETPFDSNGDDEAFAVLVQPDDKVLAAGSSEDEIALARYNANGTLDSSFGTGGKVVTPTGTDGSYAWAIALQADGRIVVAGDAGGDFVVRRYEADGTPDTGFGSGGFVVTPFENKGAWATSVVVQASGRIVVAGSARNDDYDEVFALARYTASGALDPTFGTGGKVMTSMGGVDATIGSLLQQPDGKLLAVGGLSWSDGVALARYSANGVLDPSFGVKGKVTTDLDNTVEYGSAGALQPDGKILVAGWARDEDYDYLFAVARFGPTGDVDDSFGGHGSASVSFAGDGQAIGVAVRPNTDIVLAGDANGDFAVARFIGASSFFTDAQVRTGVGAYRGNGVYDITSPKQSVTKRMPAGKTATFGLRIENDGAEDDAFTILGCLGSAGFTETYFSGGTNVTAAVLDGTFVTNTLSSGAHQDLTLKIKAKATSAGKRRSCYVHVISAGDQANDDAVVATVRAT